MGARDVGTPSAEELSALARDAQRAAAALLAGHQVHGSAPAPAAEDARHVLVREVNPHRFRGLSLADYIEGMARLTPEETLLVNPQDAAELGVARRGFADRHRRWPEPAVSCTPRSQGRAGALVPAFVFGRRRCQPRSRGGALMFKIVKLQRMVPNIHLMEVDAPEVAEQMQPGQFVIVRAAEGGERIPLSVADWDRKAGTVTDRVHGSWSVDGQAGATQGG